MFFKVRGDSFGYVVVELRQPRKRWGSRMVADAVVLPGNFASGEAAVARGKQIALADYWGRAHDRKMYREALGEK
ncbi:hypothetical protein [Streptomyces cyaneofuscatus]|uniref:hypothetical protein n=1 Tax=Streptomyces cyaneofuscatus TaxID=66883 RepID=UPI0036449C65